MNVQNEKMPATVGVVLQNVQLAIFILKLILAECSTFMVLHRYALFTFLRQSVELRMKNFSPKIRSTGS